MLKHANSLRPIPSPIDITGKLGMGVVFFQQNHRFQRDKTITIWLFDIAMENGPFLVGKPSINGPSIPWLC
jgi:hypothetical protein